MESKLKIKKLLIIRQISYKKKLKNKIENIQNKIDNNDKIITEFEGKQAILEQKIEGFNEENAKNKESIQEYNEKIEKLEKAQEDNSRKYKNLAIAVEERLEVSEERYGLAIAEEMKKLNYQGTIEEINGKIDENALKLQEKLELIDAKVKNMRKYRSRF